ncbi:MAG: ComEC/Rec2-related protein [Candidatus Gottesmanbacteria bacterium GW2011_GWC2_39_8]|uniref:ComEC/Rec2-related protein n=1 Tax=Candidatus Gottesmanbacteria bacterium GW2011_GWC2_39_8 TaxID=1618450 RepID=A0A0G0SB29_9BACT|nr:MAG: ComEC/Rec2-related protein [Candidatus Gottesmanbacteria bacterium GW2011_GWC2_39_8]
MPNPFVPIINSYLPEPHASLLNGILFGIKATMPKSFYYGLRDVGLLHIIALSGMNITILINLFAKGTLYLGRRISITFTIIAIFLFVVFVGPSPSIVRAAIMGTMSLLSIYFGRLSWGLLSLVLASIIMLLTNFTLISDLSFQLSFLATLGIILAGKYTKCQKTRGLIRQSIHCLKENLILTLAAQLFTLPIIIYHFHRLSLVAPISNLLVEWTMQPIMVIGFVTAIFGFIWWPLGLVPAWTNWVLLTYFIKVVEILDQIPGASIKF